jgi:hypothetical protein
MLTSEAVTFAKSATGFSTSRIAITDAVTTKILVLRIRDEITALSQAFSKFGSSACSERKRGKGWFGVKPSFVGIGDASTLNANRQGAGRLDGPLEKPGAQIQAVSCQAETCAQNKTAKKSDGLERMKTSLSFGNGADGNARNRVHRNLQMLE